MTALAPRTTAQAASVPPRRAPKTNLWNLGAITAIWGTSLYVVALWVHGSGVTDLLAGGGGSLTTLGRLTGLVAANLLLYQVLLMARVPLFERGFGRDGITRMHRTVGFWSFWLMLAHIVLTVIGYAISAQLNLVAQLWQFIWDYPGMLLATAGTVLICVVVFTSMRVRRRKMRYENWHLLHLYAYLGVFLAVPHMLWTGGDFLASTAATIYWWALWAATLAAVLIWRLAVPAIRSWRHELRVVAVERDGAGGVSVRMRGRGMRRLGTKAGQFFQWRFLTGTGWTRGNPFSIAEAPFGDDLVISARIVGDGTKRLATLTPGTRVLFEGPYGTMTGEARTGRTLLMLGAGAGVAPLVSLLQAEAYAPGEAVLLTREHTAEDAMRTAAVSQLVAHRGLVHYALPGPRSRVGSSWLPQSHAAWAGPDLLRHIAPSPTECDVFVCGPGPWMDAIVTDLRAAGIPNARIHRESFTI